MSNIINVNISWPSPPRLPIDPDAKDLISKILKKKPSERISLENMVKHSFFIKYCPNIKPILDKKQKYHLKPFVVSKDIPSNDDDYDDNENYISYHQLRLLRTSNKKNKIRDITPSPNESKLSLDKKSRSKVNINDTNNNNILFRQNTKAQLKTPTISTKLDTPKGDEYDIIKIVKKLKYYIKENQKLEKENENYKLREIGYNKKIEELIFALNNINQENMLLKLDLENQKKELEKFQKELEKRKKEITRLRSTRNLNLNLNNQTTFNINTTDGNRSGRSNNYKKLNNKKNSNNKTNNNTIIRSNISKTPEGLQHKGRRIILIKNAFMKPYLKKNILLNKCNKSLNKDEDINTLKIV
jgi:hypothetical protein